LTKTVRRIPFEDSILKSCSGSKKGKKGKDGKKTLLAIFALFAFFASLLPQGICGVWMFSS